MSRQEDGHLDGGGSILQVRPLYTSSASVRGRDGGQGIRR